MRENQGIQLARLGAHGDWRAAEGHEENEHHHLKKAQVLRWHLRQNGSEGRAHGRAKPRGAEGNARDGAQGQTKRPGTGPREQAQPADPLPDTQCDSSCSQWASPLPEHATGRGAFAGSTLTARSTRPTSSSRKKPQTPPIHVFCSPPSH